MGCLAIVELVMMWCFYLVGILLLDQLITLQGLHIRPLQLICSLCVILSIILSHVLSNLFMNILLYLNFTQV